MKSTIGIIVTELFQVSLVTYLVLLLAENIVPGAVSDFFNLNILLALVVVSAVLMVLPVSEKKWKDEKKMLQKFLHLAFEEWDKEVERVKKSRFEWLYVFLVSYGGGALVYYKTRELGLIAVFLAFLSGIIIWLLSQLILHEEH